MIELRYKMRELREGQGLSREKLARRVGLSAVHLARIELGTSAPPLGTLARIFSALGYQVVWSIEPVGDTDKEAAPVTA